MNTVSSAQPFPVPLLPVLVSCGFPSPAAAYAARPLVLDDWLWPARASCQLVAAADGGRIYLVADEALRPVPGDRIWLPDREQLLTWPADLTGTDSPGLVVAATLQLYRRRPDPGPAPASVHDWLIRHPCASYFVRAEGRSMTAYGIHHGSLLVVDRRAELHDRDIVIVGCAEGFLVKQYRTSPARLVAGHRDYPDVVLSQAREYVLDGVVIACITKHRQREGS